MFAPLPRRPAPDPTWRLIPSRFPPVSAFDAVAGPDDLAAVMELEGWTNDRLVNSRLARLPRADWVFGRANASIVMAAFLHAAPAGLRFSGGDLGAWYGAFALNTAIAEVAHHLRRETVAAGLPEMRSQYRAYLAQLQGDYVDIRGMATAQPGLYAASDYRSGQYFGETARAAGETGLLYDSVRHMGGANVVCYRPRAIQNVRQAGHYEITVRPAGKILVRPLAAG